jgi:predicted nucleic acid-binding protein
VTASRAAVEGHDQLAMSASALAECMVGPARRGAAAIAVVDELVDRLPVAVVALGREVTREAARLRARHRSLRLPDALVIATAVVDGADRIVTTDRAWPPARALRISPAIERL